MNIVLWILQGLLALHTGMGAVWKFSHPAGETMPSLKAIPDGLWSAMGALELALAVALVLPAVYRPMAMAAPIAALCILAEMLLFSGMHLHAGDGKFGPIAYWLVVSALCAFIAYGRWTPGA